jgi:Fe-S-cluster containining protein
MEYKSKCGMCGEESHCCIFKSSSEFAFVGIRTARDIKKKTGKDYSYFLDYSPLPKKAVNALRDDDPALEGMMRYQQLDKNRILRLKAKKDGRCIFLGDNGCCSIYSFRPNICRMFPFWAIKLTDRSVKVIRHDFDIECGAISHVSEEVEEHISKKEIQAIKKLFNDMIKENKDYKKNIRKFARCL